MVGGGIVGSAKRRRNCRPEGSRLLLAPGGVTAFCRSWQGHYRTGRRPVPSGKSHHSPRSSGNPQAQVVVPVRRLVPVAVRRPAVGRVVVPAAAPDHPVGGPGPPTGHCSNTARRKFQLQSPGVCVKATSAVPRCCNSRSSTTPARKSRSRRRSLRRKRTRLRRLRIWWEP